MSNKDLAFKPFFTYRPRGDGVTTSARGRKDMARHRFKVGESVDFRPARAGVPVATSTYEIIRLVPIEGHEVKYRIKADTEPYERVAREHELSQTA